MRTVSTGPSDLPVTLTRVPITRSALLPVPSVTMAAESDT